MPNESGKPPRPPDDRADPPYRIYRSAGKSRPGGGRSATSEREDRPYTTYRSTPRGLRDRLRDPQDAVEEDARRGLGRPSRAARRRDPESDRPGGRGPGGPGRRRWPGRARGRRGITPWRVVRWVLGLAVAWVLLSVVLFFISAQSRTGSLPAGAKSQLAGGSTMLVSPETVLIVGLDNRPTTGAGSKEGGLTSAQRMEKYAHTDSIMLWRVGGGVSRRLSIPRDTLVNIPGCGEQKINAAWSCGGPGLTLRVIKRFTGIHTINHMVVVDLANFPKFIDDIGGVNVRTGRICSNISGGVKNGGFTLNLKPGVHHLSGIQALTLARTRDNSCDPAYNDLNREAAQQRILNSIKSQLLTAHTFFHLPWVAWDAPGVIQTDMGGLSLMQLFLSAEIGGTATPRLLSETPSVVNGADVLVPHPANVRAEVRRLMTGR
ncbi:MAG TPA: LCP family protein [Solirubrobacteraceae bacterium]|nr:LCP family protein [Solirubrobacteraceae bacterium]